MTLNVDAIAAVRKAEGDKAAADAQNAIVDLPADADAAFRLVANWWSEWYRSAGHKRLAKILLEYSDGERER